MRFLLLLIFIFQSYNSYSNFEWNTNCDLAYKKIINLEFDLANKIISNEKKENPSNKIVFLLENYIDFFKIQIGEEKSDYLKNIEIIEYRISSVSAQENNSKWHNYCLAEMYIQTAANRLKFGDYLKASFEINKAYRLLLINKNNYPDFIPNNKSFAVLETIIGSIPEKYDWILSLANMNGSVSNGIKSLKEIIKVLKTDNKFNYLIDETYFYYSFLKMNLQNNESELQLIINDIKDSPLQILNFACNRLANKLGQNQLALSVLENRKKYKNAYPFYYLDFLIGKEKLNKLDFSAKNHFSFYTNNFKGENYVKSSYMYLSWIALFENDSSLFKIYQKKIDLFGSSLVGSDKEAQNFFSDKTIPNTSLLKARLLFDGGFYTKSLTTLKSNKYDEKSDLFLESSYREAVNYFKLKQTEKAIEKFELTYKLGKSKKYYYSAKSALNLAYIFFEKENYSKSKEYFQKCIELKYHEYEQSLEQKAKAGLNNLKISNP